MYRWNGGTFFSFSHPNSVWGVLIFPACLFASLRLPFEENASTPYMRYSVKSVILSMSHGLLYSVFIEVDFEKNKNKKTHILLRVNK